MSTHHILLGQRTCKVVLTSTSATVDGIPIPVNLRELQPGVLSLLLTLPDGTTRSFRALADPPSDPATPNDPAQPALIINSQRIPYTLADPRSLRATAASTTANHGPRPLKAPMPGRIVRVLVTAGDTVEAGQGCVVIEAMKMQNELKAPRAGTVTRLTATPGDTVPPGTTLLFIE